MIRNELRNRKKNRGIVKNGDIQKHDSSARALPS
jgi:hypothetical protein